MAIIQPISTTRVSSAMQRDRLAAQIQSDQIDLFKLQNQLSTGQRIFLPSDDASAAQRVIALQRTLERKAQSLTNLQGATSALATADGALADVSNKLSEIKADGLATIDSFTSEEQRSALLSAVDGLIEQLTQTGNSRFTGSFFFGGTETASPPYNSPGTYIEYHGDEASPQTFVDVGFLFDTGVAGDDVFGGLSETVRGAVDLDPQLTPGTRLSQLNGGIGIDEEGSFEIVFEPTASGQPTTRSVVDLSRADTLEDVTRLIEQGAPEGTTLAASVSGNGLRITATDGTIVVAEVAGGAAAAQLGLPVDAAPTADLQGADLDPVLRVTTRLEDLVGVKSRGRLELAGPDNDLEIVAAANGASFNDLTVVLENTVTAGSESASYDSLSNTLTVSISDGFSTANDVAAAINAEGSFTAQPDPLDSTQVPNRGTGTVSVSGSPHTSVTDTAGEDGAIDLASGLLITNGAETYTINTSTAETVEDLLNLLNQPEYGLAAGVNAAGDGIDIRTRRSGADFAIAENGGSTASDLGVLTYRSDSNLSDFNHGVGVVLRGDGPGTTAALNDFRITLTDAGVSTTYAIDVTSAATVQDVVDQIAADTGGVVTASLQTTGNGLVLTTNNAAIAGNASSGTIGLGTSDTLTFTADSLGAAGDQDFTIELVDSGSGGLATSVVGNAITIDLGGSTPGADAVAADLSANLPGFSVSSSGSATITPADVFAPAPFSTTGGVDPSPPGADSITVEGSVAERLGFFGSGELSATSGTGQISAGDANPRQAESVFTTLIRMREALAEGDVESLGRQVNQLDEDIKRVSFSRAEIGSRLRSLESIQFRIADEEVQLREALSRDLDADLVEVISDFTSRQASLQASLQVSGLLANLTILDYI